MKNIFLFNLTIATLLLGFSGAVLAEPNCAHAFFNYHEIKQLGVKNIRLLVTDDQIAELMNNPNSQTSKTHKRKLKQLHSDGVGIILTLRFPENKGETFKFAFVENNILESDAMENILHYDRIPVGNDRKMTLELIAQFLDTYGSYINAVQLNNELAGGPGSYSKEQIVVKTNGVSQAIEWLTVQANHLKKLRGKNPELTNLKIIGPSIAGIGEYLDGTKFPDYLVTFTHDLITFSNQHTDAIDIHLHVRDIDHLKESYDYVHERAKKPIVVLEWSQAKIIKKWLHEPLNNDITPSASTNLEYLTNSYKQKVTSEQWEKFVESSPIEASFIHEAYEYLKNKNVSYACYAPMRQFGDVFFDILAPFPQFSVQSTTQKEPRNTRIYNALKEMIE